LAVFRRRSQGRSSGYTGAEAKIAITDLTKGHKHEKPSAVSFIRP
jgi:hypothetical protein